MVCNTRNILYIYIYLYFYISHIYPMVCLFRMSGEMHNCQNLQRAVGFLLFFSFLLETSNTSIVAVVVVLM